VHGRRGGGKRGNTSRLGSSARSLSRSGSLSFHGSSGIDDRLLRGDVRCLAAANAWSTGSFGCRTLSRQRDSVRRGRRGHGLGGGDGALTPTRSRRRRCSGAGEADALLALPPCPNP